MQLARKILFYFFALIYAVVCPFIILYSFGYIYQPGEKDISQTGLIHLSTNPADANIYLGKSRFKNKTPATITELKPGKYKVSVRLKNYRPWNRQVTIEPGKSAAFKNILLLPKKFDRIDISPDATYADLTAIKGTNYFILQKGPRIKEFYAYNWRKETRRVLPGTDAVPEDFTVNSMFSEDKSNLIVIYGGAMWNKKYFLIDLDAKDPSPIEITKIFSGQPNSIVWANDIPKDIFALYDDRIDRLDIQSISVYPRYFDKAKGFGLSDKWLYALGMDNTVLKTTLDKEREAILFEDKNLGKGLFSRSRFYDIRKIDRDILVFWGNRGDLITTMPPYRVYDEGVVGMDYNESAYALLFWTKSKIWTADFSKKDEAGFLTKGRLPLNDIYHGGANITQCFWVYAGSHVLFKDKNEVYLLELAPDGNYRKEYIVSAKENTAVFYNEIDGSLYYLDQKGALMKIKILPNAEIIFQPFMEEEGKNKP